MLNKAQAYRLVPWAWSAAWMLILAGATITDIPSRGPAVYFALSALGGVAAGLVTAAAAGEKTGVGVRLAAWAVAYLAAVPLGLVWLYTWSVGYLGTIAAAGLAGVIGGVFNTMRPGTGRWVSAALLGLVF